VDPGLHDDEARDEAAERERPTIPPMVRIPTPISGRPRPGPGATPHEWAAWFAATADDISKRHPSIPAWAVVVIVSNAAATILIVSWLCCVRFGMCR
jgi:hypothetical protein